MSLLDYFKPDPPKKWDAHGHTVKKITVQKKKRVTEFSGPHGSKEYKMKPYTVMRYKCVDCEQVKENRDGFKEKTCWEVVEE